jgi:YihY family inner membrane protein
MNIIAATVGKFDAFQKKHPVIGFPLAVFIKFGDDQAGYQAALITYYAFVSLFPLLLVGFSLVPLLVRNDPDLQQRIITATVDYFPVIGQDLARNIHAYHGHGWALVAGLLFILYGARGIANVLQDASNSIWQVVRTKRPGFPFNLLRSIGIIGVGGIGLIATTVIMGFVTGISRGGVPSKILLGLLTLFLNTLVFLVVARLATSSAIVTKKLWIGAVFAALFWHILQVIGSVLVWHQIKGTSTLYGTFAVVLGLLFWLYLQAQFYIYALQIAAVRHNILWPRNIIQPPFNDADRKVYTGYVKTERRKKEELIQVEFSKKSKM